MEMSAPRCSTTAQPCTALRMACSSRRSPPMISMRARRLRRPSRPAGRHRRGSCSARTPARARHSAASRSVRWLPMKPPAPVTRTGLSCQNRVIAFDFQKGALLVAAGNIGVVGFYAVPIGADPQNGCEGEAVSVQLIWRCEGVVNAPGDDFGFVQAGEVFQIRAN